MILSMLIIVEFIFYTNYMKGKILILSNKKQKYDSIKTRRLKR